MENNTVFKNESERFHNIRSTIAQLLEKGITFKKPFPMMDFIKAPASTKYHGNYEGGLYDHSYTVMESLIDLTNDLGLQWQRPESPIIVGLFHDLCKIDQYIATPDGPHPYTYNNDTIIDGHGEKSVIYLQQYIDLTEEEIACIRWHMGAFDEKERWNFYSRAVKRYPNVLYTHTADMTAAHIKGV